MPACPTQTLAPQTLAPQATAPRNTAPQATARQVTDSRTVVSRITATGTLPARNAADSVRGVARHPVLAQFDADWAEARERHDGLAAEWARDAPDLTGCGTLDDVVARCRTSDAAFAPLLALARRRDPVAGRCVLQIMVPSLVALSHGDPRGEIAEYLSACWLVVMAWPDHRRTHLVTAIAWQTRRQVTRERRRRLAPAPLQDDLPAEMGARAVLQLAGDRSLVPAASIRALEAVYAEGLTGKEAAERLGMSHDMVRYRCSSAVRTLRKHREELVELLYA